MLQQQLQTILSTQGEMLLYIWGEHGSGKSHLLQACCQTVSSTQSSIYLPLSMLKEWGPDVIDGTEEQALIGLDDIDAIAGEAAWEEAIFHLYNRIRDNGQTILIISGNLPPTQLPIRLPDLRSRLSWGLVIQLNELSDGDKIKSLQQLARKRGFELPEVVGQFLINRCARNMHDLQTLLDRLDEASLVAQRKITVPFAKEILGI